MGEEPLTPNHLVIGRRLNKNFGGGEEIQSIERETEKINEILNYFWKIWSREYLLELRDIKQKMYKNSKTQQEIQIGDIVLIEEDKVKRNNWRIGRVNKLFNGRDGNVRGAEILVANKQSSGKLNRPVNKLYPFEVEHVHKTDNETSDEEDNVPEIMFISDEKINSINPFRGEC